ncbi:MAG TPA: LytTR family DNA-binding domain-containing protein [Chryseolinea sp.]|nr:LytTR family DNA-binding domain-containing protein [Chryseolinea sp.]HPM28849.1 LytTR family DNA-binding domain-containing protein [Chryseolinea sp.]
MKVLIVEDEPLAAERLQLLLKICESDVEIIDQIDSVEETVSFFKSGKKIDLLFLDIQLADGKSFEIFDKVKVDVPIIFTTAFDQYAMQAFKVYSIDYLLKPLQQTDLQKALDKFKKLLSPTALSAEDLVSLKALLAQSTKSYKERFIIKSGNKLHYKPASEVAYFYADGKSAFLVSKKENRKYLVDHTLEELESTLDPKTFFRISRKFILAVDSISEVKGLISTKLEVKLNQPCEHDLSVSRDRAQDFKNWLDR